jgi:hypothetical protein
MQATTQQQHNHEALGHMCAATIAQQHPDVHNQTTTLNFASM